MDRLGPEQSESARDETHLVWFLRPTVQLTALKVTCVCASYIHTQEIRDIINAQIATESPVQGPGGWDWCKIVEATPRQPQPSMVCCGEKIRIQFLTLPRAVL